MKILIIILVILFIIYLLKNKKEFFYEGKKKLVEDELLKEKQNLIKKLREEIKLTNEEIDKKNTRGREDTLGRQVMTERGYIDEINRHIVNNFKSNLLFKTIKDSHFTEREDITFSNIVSKNRDVSTRERYLYYLNFCNLGEKQKGINKIKYNFAVDFISTFRPNVILTFYLKYAGNMGKNINNNRIRYVIYDKEKNKAIFTNFIFYDDLSLKNNKIVKSNFSQRYEPRIKGKFLEYLDNIKDTFTEKSTEKSSKKFAFEDFNKINKKEISYEDGYITIKLHLYITNGNYGIQIIVDTKDSIIIPKKINYKLEHNYYVDPEKNKIYEKKDIKLHKINNDYNDNDNFLKITLNDLTTDFNRFIYQLKNEGHKGIKNLQIDFSNNKKRININPQRNIKYVRMYLFIIFYQIHLKTNQKTIRTAIKLKFNLFKNAFEKKYVDRREYIPSKEYKLLDNEATELTMKDNLDATENSILQSIDKELIKIKTDELNKLYDNKTQEFTEKIHELKKTYDNIKNNLNKIPYLNKIKIKSHNDLNETETHLESFISFKFSGHSMPLNNNKKVMECIYYIYDKFINFLPDEEGNVIPHLQSKNTIGEIFKHKFETEINYFQFNPIPKPNDTPPPQRDNYFKDYFKVEKPKPIIKTSTSFDNIWTKIIKQIKKNFRQIIEMKEYNTLGPELELLLKSIKRNSKNSIDNEDKKKYKLILDKTLCLVNLIKEGDIEKINSLIEFRTPAFLGPTDSSIYLDRDGEAISCKEKFSNYNLMENFIGINHNLIKNIEDHKHTSNGRVDFKYEWGDPEKKEFEGKFDEYNLLNDNQKENVLKKYYGIHDTLIKADTLIDNYLKKIEEKSVKLDYNKILKGTTQEIKESLSKEEIEEQYNKKEIQQKDKILKINKKLNQLEKIQNKKYVGDLDEYNSIKSFGDGQIISIKKFKKDIYNILVNDDCLGFNKKGNLSSNKCNNEKSQQFSIKNMNNLKDYNKLIHLNNGEIATEYDNIDYPFQIMNPILHKSQCLTLNGNSIGVKECINSNKQRWEGLKKIKICDNFNQN